MSKENLPTIDEERLTRVEAILHSIIKPLLRDQDFRDEYLRNSYVKALFTSSQEARFSDPEFKVIYDELTKRVGRLDHDAGATVTETVRLQDRIGRLEAELYTNYSALALVTGISDAAIVRYLGISVFFSKDPYYEDRDRIRSAIRAILASIDFDSAVVLSDQQGSWFHQWIARSKKALTREEVVERLSKSERALELALLQSKQSEIDKNQAGAAAELISAIKDRGDAVIRMGSILIVQHTDASGRPCIVARSLTQREMIELERNPDLLHEPTAILSALSALSVPPPRDESKQITAPAETLPPDFFKPNG